MSKQLRAIRKLLILGDFNLPKTDWKNLTSCSPTELNFCETLKDFYLSQMVLSPTRITDESQSILDLFITNNPDNILNLHVVNPLDMQFLSDHLLVLFDFIWKPKRPPKQSRFVYSYKKADFDALRDTLDATPFLCALDNENVDDDWQCWHDLFIACVEQHVPKIKIRDINSPPWIDGEVIHLLHKKDSARKKALSRNRGGDARTSQNPAWEKYRKLRRESKALIDRKHKEYLDSIASSVCSNPKRFWSHIKARTKSGSVPNTVSHNSNKFTSPETIAEAFNDFFYSSFTDSSAINSNTEVHNCTTTTKLA